MAAGMRRGSRAVALLAVAALAGCMSAAEHRAAVRDDSTDRLTVGTVQREVKVGMSSAEVVEILGAPNMVTTDDQRRETWVYDRIATEATYSTSSGGAHALVLGGGVIAGGLVGGLGGAEGRQSAGASATSQRTLTIIIKYDEHSRVRDFSYRSSSF